MDSSAIGGFSSKSWVHQTSTQPIDLTHCDLEQVQFPGAIMPHGVLLLLSPSDFRIQGASANTHIWFGTEVTALLQGKLNQIFSPATQQTLEKSLALITEAQLPHHLGNFPTLKGKHQFDVFAHRSNTVLILEFEPIADDATENLPTERFVEIANCITKLQKANTWQEAMTIGVNELKRLTGFDSVVGACFLDDGSFDAVAEACESYFPSVLNKRFPRSDIPEPGRRQMLLMPVQHAYDLDYEPVPIVIANQTQDPLQLDLGLAMLRSISPMCRRFYKNMGVQSRMVMSLTHQDQLWGFFSCKNITPHSISYTDRQAFQLFADMSALVLIEKARTEQFQAALQVKDSITDIINTLSDTKTTPVDLYQLPEQLLNSLDVIGVALCLDQNIISAGITPDATLIKDLKLWLDTQNQALFTTDRLPTLFKPTSQSLAQATGLLAAHLKRSGQYLLCFRPEKVQEINWAGDPLKQIKIDPISGEERLTPRGSFEVWKQDVRGTARAWQPYEIEAISDLQQTIIRLQYADKQRILQARLAQSNTELEAFAYIVSHDLQEPLRGISNFTQLLMQSNPSEHLGQQELKWLDTILKLSGRMSDQINALLQYSRASQQVMSVQSVDLNLLLNDVVEDLSTTIEHTQTQIKITRTLPIVNCDPIRVASVFNNLITNAIKYNDQLDKQVEIGCINNPTLTFFVRDNGIGIPEKFFATIFDIFRRLHGRNDYSGGTGAGLSIAHKHIERHGGRLWLESAMGQGTTFYFTLGSNLALTLDNTQILHD